MVGMTHSDTMKKRIAVLGSTGSIGCQALEIIRTHPGNFVAEVLTARRNAGLLISQAIEFQPNAVVIGEKSLYPAVKKALSSYPVKVYAGDDALSQVVEMDTIDILLVAMMGFAGLRPVINGLKAGKRISLANKECLVVAGDLVTRLSSENRAPIIPVDSEHSAIFQCLAGEEINPPEKIILTASGGPFRGKDKGFLEKVTARQALDHPNWKMGDKITIDSASLMNKGLEVIEAKWLFGVQPGQVEVLIHPQSVIHSLVQFADRSVKAQLSLPDMRLPILYSFTYPLRLTASFPRLDLTAYPSLTFERPDTDIFRNLALAYEAVRRGGNAPCVLNAANEVAVQSFLSDEIGFMEITGIIEKCLEGMNFIDQPSLEDYFATDQETRRMAQALLRRQ
jgi:1-deoxy-D-xylulose-5-phosphate reductoisomerase